MMVLWGSWQMSKLLQYCDSDIDLCEIGDRQKQCPCWMSQDLSAHREISCRQTIGRVMALVAMEPPPQSTWEYLWGYHWSSHHHQTFFCLFGATSFYIIKSRNTHFTQTLNVLLRSQNIVGTNNNIVVSNVDCLQLGNLTQCGTTYEKYNHFLLLLGCLLNWSQFVTSTLHFPLFLFVFWWILVNYYSAKDRFIDG